LLRFLIISKGVKQLLDFRVSEEFSIEICCYLNWLLFNDQTIIQGHHLDKHNMVDQMPLLVDQFSF
jgi:hypothetical protein